MGSRVTTKRGDTGDADTLGGDRLPKSHPVFECSGQVDMLRAQTALAYLELQVSGTESHRRLDETLQWLLHIYFLIGSHCNDPLNTHPEYRQLDLVPDHLKRLEAEQALLEASLRLPKSFILAASTPVAAQLDIACTQARALERSIVRLKETIPDFDVSVILPFVNRLSDYLFIAARVMEDGKHATVDYDSLRDAEPRAT